MSAFFVGSDHVNAILSSHYYDRRNSLPKADGGWTRDNDERELTELGKSLLAENIKSLQDRYPTDWQELVDLDINDYRFEPNLVIAKSPITIIKLCQSLDYQSCEHDGWKDSHAFRVLTSIKDAMVYKMPGYEEAPWHYCKAA